MICSKMESDFEQRASHDAVSPCMSGFAEKFSNLRKAGRYRRIAS
jgi:hypothetical protein